MADSDEELSVRELYRRRQGAPGFKPDASQLPAAPPSGKVAAAPGSGKAECDGGKKARRRTHGRGSDSKGDSSAAAAVEVAPAGAADARQDDGAHSEGSDQVDCGLACRTSTGL